MMFALICRDKPGALQVRKDNRDAHIAYVKNTGAAFTGGPFLDDDGQMIGSMLILDVPDKAAAQAWADGDPYGQAGLFESVELIAWKKVIG